MLVDPWAFMVGPAWTPMPFLSFPACVEVVEIPVEHLLLPIDVEEFQVGHDAGDGEPFRWRQLPVWHPPAHAASGGHRHDGRRGVGSGGPRQGDVGRVGIGRASCRERVLTGV